MKPRFYFILLCAFFFSVPPAQAEPPAEALRAIGLADYLSRDYALAVASEGGRVLSEAEYREVKDFASLIGGYLDRLSLDKGNEAQKTWALLDNAIKNKSPEPQVKKLALHLRSQLVSTFSVLEFPSEKPDVVKGREMYSHLCAVCHGPDGKARTPTATQLNPPPAVFAAETLDSLSPFQAYQTISFGVNDTAMPAFGTLSEQDRWSLAAFLFLLRDNLPAPAGGEAKVGWKQSMSLSDGQLKEALAKLGVPEGGTLLEISRVRRLGADQVPTVLRTAGATVPSGQGGQAMPFLLKAREWIERSVEEARAGRMDAAMDLSVSAYLDGFEKAEPVLAALGGGHLVIAAEREFLDYRETLRKADGHRDPKAAAEGVLQALRNAEDLIRRSRGLTPGVALLGAFSIIFREGLEALLLLAVILSVVRPLPDRRFKRAVHQGWATALAAGVLTWVIAQKILTGAGRERMEGWVSLLAAFLLIYVSFWLIAKRDGEQWKRFLLGKIKGKSHLGLLSLGSIAFLAVYREVFETILFMEALKMQAPGQLLPLIVGVAAAVLGLALTAWAIFRLGKWIPLHIFFGASGVFLYLLAVIFAGQGIHSLQEAGAVTATMIPFVRIPALGIFPNAEGLSVQGVLILVFLGGLLWQQWVRSPREEEKLEQKVIGVSGELLSLHELEEHLLSHLRELKAKLGQKAITQELLQEIIGHTEDLDRGIRQVILRLEQVSSEIPKNFQEIYSHPDALGAVRKDS